MDVTRGSGEASAPANEGAGTAARVVSAAWNSAFFRFAGSIRDLTRGAINYKALYALIGTHGRFINHESPAVRKRTAASLSRLMHSIRYAEDMRERFHDDPSVFAESSRGLVERLRDITQLPAEVLLEILLGDVWRGIRAGLEDEMLAGRPDVNLERIDREHVNLASWCRALVAEGGDPLADLVASYLHILAFGSLDERFARSLSDPTPLDAGTAAPGADGAGACGTAAPGALESAGPCDPAARVPGCFIARLAGEEEYELSAIWVFAGGRMFKIGRYTDCDAIEENPYVSRLHARVYEIEGTWYVEDAASRHGTRVLRLGPDGVRRVAWESPGPDRAPDSDLTFPLAYGDMIELAGASRYLFGAFSAAPAAGDLCKLELDTDGSMETRSER